MPHPRALRAISTKAVYLNGFVTPGPGRWLDAARQPRPTKATPSFPSASTCPHGRNPVQLPAGPSISANASSTRAAELFRRPTLPRREMRYDGDPFYCRKREALRDPQTLFASAAQASAKVRLAFTAQSPCPTAARRPHEACRPCMAGFLPRHLTSTAGSRRNPHRRRKASPIDGGGWRDHFWGRGYWQAIYYYRLFPRPTSPTATASCC